MRGKTEKNSKYKDNYGIKNNVLQQTFSIIFVKGRSVAMCNWGIESNLKTAVVMTMDETSHSKNLVSQKSNHLKIFLSLLSNPWAEKESLKWHK